MTALSRQALSVLARRNGNLHTALRFGLSTTHFGFQNVDEEEKQKKVFHVFENVAHKYDLMNDAMSLGIHRLWKDCFVRNILPIRSLKCIDVAGGTGDIAFRIHRFALHEPHALGRNLSSKASGGSDGPQITLCDINPSMIEVGKSRAQKLNIDKINWVVGDAEDMPFGDNSFDLYTIAFGIRNCTHVEKVLSEAFRILKPGGRFFCLEFSNVVNPLFRKLYDVYSMELIPVMGQLIAGDWDSYQYLVESIRRFPDQKTFSFMIQDAGFSPVRFTNYTGGICAVHSGFKPTLSSPDTDICK